MFVMRTCDSTAVVVWVVPDVARALKNTVIMKINITGLTACAGEVSSTIETRWLTRHANVTEGICSCRARNIARILIEIRAYAVETIGLIEAVGAVLRALLTLTIGVIKIKNGTLVETKSIKLNSWKWTRKTYLRRRTVRAGSRASQAVIVICNLLSTCIEAQGATSYTSVIKNIIATYTGNADLSRSAYLA